MTMEKSWLMNDGPDCMVRNTKSKRKLVSQVRCSMQTRAVCDIETEVLHKMHVTERLFVINHPSEVYA